MIIDLLSAVILTASAAIVVAVLSICLGANPATRIRVAASLGFWFAVVVALAATRVFDNTVGFGVRGLGIAVAVPIAILVVIFAPSSIGAGAAFPHAPLVAQWCSVGSRHWNSFCGALCEWPTASAVRSDCGVGRHLCGG